jgi:D-lactate dehydrogenase
MKNGVYIINTSRGALIDSDAMVEEIKNLKIGAAGLDVYEEEGEFFYEDLSNEIVKDDTLRDIITMPNVLVTSHQAFLTREALEQIARTTLDNLKAYFDGKPLVNEVKINQT